MRDLLTWFGDDFTGSSDVLLQYTRAGLPALLFLGTPDAEDVARAAEQHTAVGIAGVTRAMQTPDIEPVVRVAFERLAAIRPRVVQYKICSTADSSVEIGSIAPAVRVGREMFGERPVAILPAQPDLGRYTVFANHFGRDSSGVHRLDRLPAMANHPVTPMTEADLRRHFARQLDADVAGLPITGLRAGGGSELFAADAVHTAVVVDSLENDDLRAAGRLLLDSVDGVVFAVGSGGLSTGLAAALGAEPDAADYTFDPPPRSCLVVSGSAAAQTSAQIDHAIGLGWRAIPLDPRRLIDSSTSADAAADAARQAIEALAVGPGAVVFTAHRDLLPPGGPGSAPSHVVGDALGRVVRDVRERTDVPRVLVAGGDTSGYVLTRLGARTLSAAGVVGSDLVLGVIGSADAAADGLEVVLKGGQIGETDVFDAALRTPARASQGFSGADQNPTQRTRSSR